MDAVEKLADWMPIQSQNSKKITARSARCLPPSPVAGLVPDSLPPPGAGPGAKDNMASVRRTLASPYRNLPTPRVASAGGSGIGDRSAIRAITLKSNLGRSARPNRTDRIAGVSSGNPSQWAYAIRTPSNGSRYPWLGPSSPLRVPLKGPKHVTILGTEFATGISPLAEPRGSASITTLTENPQLEARMYTCTRVRRDCNMTNPPKGTRAMRGVDERSRGSGMRHR